MIFILNLQLQWVSKENPSVRIHNFSFLVRYAECFVSYFGVNTVGTSLGNEFSTSSLANNGAEGSLAHSEIPTVYVSDTTSAEEGPHISVVSNSDGGFHIDNRSQGIISPEEGVAVPCLEILDMYELITRSGRRGGKFQRKPKIQIGRQKPGADTSHPDAVESIPCPQQAQSIPSETEYMNEGSNLAFPSNNIVDFPSLRFDDSTSELPVNEPTTNFMDASHSEASFPGEHPEAAPKIPEKVSSKCRKRKNPVTDDSPENQKDSISDQENEADRSTRLLRKRKNGCELVDESEEEANVDGDFSYECPSGSLVDEDDNDNDNAEYQGEKEPQKRRAPTKYEKSVPQKENPVRKQKKVNEEVEKSTKAPHKKFSHSTRRKRRQVNRVLLETPEDEIDIQSLCIRDVIMLADYRERISSKEGKTSEAPLGNPSASNSFTDNNEDEAFASDQGGFNDDETNPIVQESSDYPNYQSYMDKTPRSRWSKQDTELFYEQFGSDISMIQQLFPGRTRRQVKLKYKKEERQHPLRLHDALTNRAKDHSHFQVVIECLQQLAAKDKQNSCMDDSIGLTGVEEEKVKHEINEEEVAKSEQVEGGQIEAMEPDVSEGEIPLKSSDSEDALCGWSQYKKLLNCRIS
ncbi:hypothetical protein HYC85_013099 [Camellia sinensis]|uniref:Transcription factor TFIIIB component B'' Myb domain-containing protein n=1 Tax=Camellia sinensis TaxID=4442 RepID=A0A7J7HGU5_CAMSI|nr:hypothetical protein HYC85_013099 [Camellia sinensis]